MFWRKKKELLQSLEVQVKTVELQAKITVLQGTIEQKNKEILMWEERGNRLGAAYDGLKLDVNNMYKAMTEMVKSPEALLEFKCKCKGKS